MLSTVLNQPKLNQIKLVGGVLESTWSADCESDSIITNVCLFVCYQNPQKASSFIIHHMFCNLKSFQLDFSCKSYSTFTNTNVHLSVSLSVIKTPPQLEIIILYSFFLHFATFKLFSLFWKHNIFIYWMFLEVEVLDQWCPDSSNSSPGLVW